MVVSVYIYIYIFTEYIKITAFQTSSVEKAGRNYCKFQAETRIKFRQID